jgi:hypothetical protein
MPSTMTERTLVSGRPAVVAYITKDWLPSTKDAPDCAYANVLFDDGLDPSTAVLVMKPKTKKQFSDFAIGVAQSYLDNPAKLAKLAKRYGPDIDKKLRRILAQQKPRGPAAMRPSLPQLLLDEENAKRVRTNALSRLPYGRGLGR